MDADAYTERLMRSIYRSIARRLVAFLILFGSIFGSLWTFLDPWDPLGIHVLEPLRWAGYGALLIVSAGMSALVMVLFRERETSLLRLETVLGRNRPPAATGTGGGSILRDLRMRWTDFDEARVIERPEVDRLIRSFDDCSIQVVEGLPASGRSVLLQHVGYRLASRRRYRVYYIGCEFLDEAHLEQEFEKALEIENSRALILIDDFDERFESFLLKHDNRPEPKPNLLLASRVRPANPCHHHAIEDYPTVRITAESLAESMIRRRLSEQTGPDTVERRIPQFIQYAHDLWILAWALELLLPELGADPQALYEKVKQRILESPDALDVLPAIAIVSRLEIPVERDFLTSESRGLGLSESSLTYLIEHDELRRVVVDGATGKVAAVAFHHLSTARLIYDAVRSTELLRSFIDRFLPDAIDDWEPRFLLRYVLHSDILCYVETESWAYQDVLRPLVEANLADSEMCTRLRRAVQRAIDDDRHLALKVSHLVGFGRPSCDAVAGNVSLARLVAEVSHESDPQRLASTFIALRGGLLARVAAQLDLRRIAACVAGDLRSSAGALAALAISEQALCAELLRLIGHHSLEKQVRELPPEDFEGLYEDQDQTNLESLGALYVELAHSDTHLARVLLDRLLLELRNEPDSVDEENDFPLALSRIVNLLEQVGQAQRTLGRVEPAVEDLLSGLQALWDEAVREKVWWEVEIGGNDDFSTANARKPLIDGITAAVSGDPGRARKWTERVR